MQRLNALLHHLEHTVLAGTPTTTVSSIAYDSRQVTPGGLFVAIRGYHVDGHTFIRQAIQRGATSIIVDRRHWNPTDSPTITGNMTLVAVPDSRLALAPLAAAFFGFPAHQMTMLGVTGTKGKTTTTSLTAHILTTCGYTTGLINSVDFQVGSRRWANKTRQSTPEAPDVQALLHDMVTAHCTHAVVEATSHALSTGWRRVDGCAFDVAVLTNLTHEHLDYHGTFEQYRADKARLFEMLGERPTAPLSPAKQSQYALVNSDDPHHAYFLAAAPPSVSRLTFALHDKHADVRATHVQATPQGSHFTMVTPWGEHPVQLALPGTFNVYNALAAISLACTQGIPLAQAAAAAGTLGGVRGRMQPVLCGQPFTVIVDYAHNPDSFEQVLGMLRPLVTNRLIVLFGSAGERDREKRPQQGAIAARYADLVIVTDEDPRAEDRHQIIAEIAAGASAEGKRDGHDLLREADRTAAITLALAQAQPGDTVLLLGKGHESSIEYADGKHPWDEMATAVAALRALGYDNPA